MTGSFLRSGALFAALAALALPARAEVRRALIVGIDRYLQPADHPDYKLSDRARVRLKAIQGTPGRRIIPKLDGASNDARAMKEILIERFGFDESNIIVLPGSDREASADNILQLLQSHLIDAAQPGDVSLFYYAGHGSRIRNRAAKNENTSGIDSTIVPADALLGVPDVRSKELARIYAQAPKKGITLTVIQDSCYSGGMSRGIAARKIRAAPGDDEISVDETLTGPLPEDQGVLVISASQDYEPAAEMLDSDLNGPHGVFTWALLHVLGASSPNDSVDRIFQRTRALMQSVVPGQEPVLLAKQGRSGRGLFGQTASAGRAGTVAASRVAGQVVKLNGGLAMNLHDGCVLKRIAPFSPALEIRIRSVSGLASADAVVSGDASTPVRPGDLFQVASCTVPLGDQLRVFVGASAPKSEVDRALTLAADPNARASLDWSADPTNQRPTHIVSWDPSRSAWTWRENRPDAEPEWIRKLDTGAISRLAAKTGGRPRVFLWIPAPQALTDSLRPGENVAVVSSLAQADYVLLGRPCAAAQTGCVEYAWALPDVFANPEQLDRPVRTDWIPLASAPDALRSAAFGLARIAGWSRLRSPESDNWPYHLALQNTKSGAILESGAVTGGECYKLLLRSDAANSERGAPARRVYLFAVDSFGKSTLLFGNNLENEFPPFSAADGDPAKTFPLTGRDCDLEISEPYGADNYFLLASATPIDNPDTIFTFDGVRTRGGPAPSDPLARLLQSVSLGTRGSVSNVPANWSIQRTTLVSRPPAH